MKYPALPKERHLYRKFTDEERDEIRRQYKWSSSRELGRAWGVSKTAILYIVNGETRRKAYERNAKRRKERMREDPKYYKHRKEIERKVKQRRSSEAEIKQYEKERNAKFRRENPNYKREWRAMRRVKGLRVT